jgi:protein-S-isoprenylcysteine O-methyltransferase Ste14
MYFGSVIMMVGMPLALGSYWGLLFMIPGVLALVLRILDEEKLLTEELAGYREYAQRVRYRLMPSVW